jgi:hypothetical protein
MTKITFQKAKVEQAYIKLCCHGPQGSGKTLTMMDIADGLCKIQGGKFLVIQNEQTGSEFYSLKNPKRKLHPEAFDYLIFKTKSINEAKDAVLEAIKDKSITCIVIDSLTKYYDDAKEIYGKKTKIGTIAMYSWQSIKNEYNGFVDLLLNCNKNCLFTARSANVYAPSEKSENGSVKIGTQAKVGADTAYEAQTVLSFETRKNTSNGENEIWAIGEKDRTSTIHGEEINWPSFENTVKRILPSLAKIQVNIEDRKEKDLADTAKKEAEFLAGSDKRYGVFCEKINTVNSLINLEKLIGNIEREIKNLEKEKYQELLVLAETKKNTFVSGNEQLKDDLDKAVI